MSISSTARNMGLLREDYLFRSNQRARESGTRQCGTEDRARIDNSTWIGPTTKDLRAVIPIRCYKVVGDPKVRFRPDGYGGDSL